MEVETIYKLTKSELIDLAKEIKETAYDSVFGLSRDQMMQKLNIKSETTFYDRIRSGKIISKEVGGSTRYFLPN